MPKNNLLKIGVAVAAAAVGAVLAITSVFAHTTPPTAGGHSIVGSIVRAEVAASFPLVKFDSAPNALINEQTADAEEAAELAAKIAAEQAELAAKQAAAAAAAAAEAAADTCVAADQTEDTSENAADKAEDTAEKAAKQAEAAAEKASGTETAAEDTAEKAAEKTEDAAEKAARQATDGAEDATEVKCAAAPAPKTFAASFGGHHSDGSKHHGGHD